MRVLPTSEQERRDFHRFYRLFAAKGDADRPFVRSIVHGIKMAHAQADEISALFPNKSCSKGCHHCCRADNFKAALNEIDVIAPHVTRDGWRRAEALAGLSDDEARKHPCPLLDLETKACTVYEHRPIVCRTYAVLSPADDCRRSMNNEKVNIRILAAIPVLTMAYVRALLRVDPLSCVFWRELAKRAPAALAGMDGGKT